MSPEIARLLAEATWQTLYMVTVAGLAGTLFGLPLGVFLATSGKGELFQAVAVNRVLVHCPQQFDGLRFQAWFTRI